MREDFSAVSSRTYISSFERRVKSPTITKVEELAIVMDLHPVALLALVYIPTESDGCDKLSAAIRADTELLDANCTHEQV